MLSMTPTNELREELREMLAETIPPGGIDSDTLFTEEQINSLLVKSVNVYMAASKGWERKADLLLAKNNGLESYSIGMEKYTFTSLEAALKFCQSRAEYYSKLAGAGSRVIKVRPPRVL